MAQIMGQRQRLGEILIAAQRPRQGARDLRDFQRMRQPGAVLIAFMGDEDLGLFLQAPEGAGMDNAVAIALEGIAHRTVGLGKQPSTRLRRMAGVRRAKPVIGRYHHVARSFFILFGSFINDSAGPYRA